MAKKSLSHKGETDGPCPKHFEISIREIRAEIEKLMAMPGGLKVLVVEDSILFRQLFKEALHDRFPSIEIYEAMDGEEALEKIEALHPHLIFMDIRLPGENGLEVTRIVKAKYPKIIVIILTGYDLPEYQEASWQYADYFLSKDSATLDNLFTLVESVLPTCA
jgi:CheY-like chemotaxis protein